MTSSFSRRSAVRGAASLMVPWWVHWVAPAKATRGGELDIGLEFTSTQVSLCKTSAAPLPGGTQGSK